MAPYVKVSSSRFQIDLQESHFSIINSTVVESTAPGKTDPTRLEILKKTQVDLLGSTPRSNFEWKLTTFKTQYNIVQYDMQSNIR